MKKRFALIFAVIFALVLYFFPFSEEKDDSASGIVCEVMMSICGSEECAAFFGMEPEEVLEVFSGSDAPYEI